jgi:hypothetical protein
MAVSVLDAMRSVGVRVGYPGRTSANLKRCGYRTQRSCPYSLLGQNCGHGMDRPGSDASSGYLTSTFVEPEVGVEPTT